MKVEYQIDENDFLTHQLFLASKSERIKTKRHRSRILLPIIYLAFGLLFHFQDKIFLTIIFFVIGLLWFFFYPLWESRHYINHYKSFIKENYKERLGRVVTLEFSHEYILAKDNGSQSKVLTIELEEISEISTAIFIRLKGGQSFILPKDKMTNFEGIREWLKELAIHLKIKYKTDENWEWK